MAATLLALTGCRQEEIGTLTVPKDTNALATVTAPTTAQPAAPAQIGWTPPPGWEEQPTGGMRAGSFAVVKGDQRADVSIVPLGRIAGSELDNVNRWRNQVGLAPVAESELKSISEDVTIGTTPVRLYDIAGSEPKANQPVRILAATLPLEGATWFFKMTGPDALVAEQKPAFKEFLKSIRFESGPPRPVSAPEESMPLPEGHPPLSVPQASASQTGPLQAADPAADPGNGNAAGKPAWDVPPAWKEQPPSSMRIGSFLVEGETGAKADVSVIRLGPDPGGLLGNVNRWRSQVGLEAVEEGDLASLITTRKANGLELTFVDLAGRDLESGNSARLLAAIASRPGGTWFYKMLGDDALVAQQKDAFVKFVESARYPHAL